MKAKPYKMTESDIYMSWFCCYADDENRAFHWDNIIRCLKDDLENNVIKKGSKQHKNLQEWFVSLKGKYEKRKENDPN